MILEKLSIPILSSIPDRAPGRYRRRFLADSGADSWPLADSCAASWAIPAPVLERLGYFLRTSAAAVKLQLHVFEIFKPAYDN